ncbi:CHAT domain-containing protein [Pseudanabaena sp. FACHB-1277]|uniref:CHAT domain-containing protein n=1 Tax=Pseudanabaena cinerea FACHB-1277 TaxID=2949581 RepID=A0A926UU65_9CYAN|nr:CHAT domain-containing protein [Pseudanabaena cinerea]MBD2151124.1 CHAT domain-containing protein [Pseudanabaena cinerea FACHB-1277]
MNNEERLQQYVVLIQEILSCPDGEEGNILSAKMELVDLGLVVVMGQYAEYLRGQGQSGAADFLLDMAAQITSFLQQENSVNPEEMSNFCNQLFAAEQENGQSGIFELLAQNLGFVNENLGNALIEASRRLIAANSSELQEYIVGLTENISIHLTDFPLGNPRGKIISAIAGYEYVLSLRTDNPEKTAQTQNNLGSAYSRLAPFSENPKQEIERAIAAYRNALRVRKEAELPQAYATTQNNLGSAYSDLAPFSENPKQEIELAIASYRNALRVRTEAELPQDFAMTQNNLGNAYSDLAPFSENPKQEIELAIASYRNALRVYTEAELPQAYAMTQNNLGSAYSNLAPFSENPKQEIENAIAAYRNALRVRKEAELPQDFAMTQNNLGNAYSRLAPFSENPKQEIENAIAAYRNALRVHTSDMRSTDCLQTARNMGNFGFKQGLWEIAIEGYSIAIEAVENIRSWSRDETRREEVQANSISIYSNIVQAYINLKQYDKAMEYVERSRSRRLVELMHSKDLYGDAEIPEEVKALLTAYEAKQQEIDRILRLLLGDERSLTATRELHDSRDQRARTEAFTAEIKILEQEKQEIWLELRRRDPVLASQQKVDALDFKAMQALISDQPHTAILNIYSTDTNVHILILRSTGEPTYFHCADLNGIGIADLNQWIYDTWLNPYRLDKKQWTANMPQFLRQLAQTLQIDRLITEHLQNIEELIIIPHRALHQIPFAALPIDPPQPPLSKGGEDKVPLNKGDLGGSYLSDRFKIRYIPSTQILKFCSDRGDVPFAEQIPQFSTVEDTREDLMFAAFEGSQIAKMFAIEQSRRLQGKQSATKTAYRQALKHSRALLSSHHAEARLDIPLESMLLLGDGAITLGELLTSRYPDIVDVFLSCCETGLGISQNLTDDIVTLGTGFLCAGARSVISSLWKVDDLATAIFSIFYHQERQKGCDRLTALQNAQTQLREMTRMDLHEIAIDWDLKAYLGKLLTPLYAVYDNIKNDPEKKEQKKEIDKLLSKLSNALALIAEPKEQKAHLKPFASPDFWAAFTIQGLG